MSDNEPMIPAQQEGGQAEPPPFAPQPFGAAPNEPRVGGCGKPVFVGCGIVFLLLGIAGVALVFKAKELLAWSLEKARPAVVANLAADVTPADRERFETAFAAALARIRAGKIDPVALQLVQAQLMKAVEKPGPGSVSRETFVALTEAFEKLGVAEPPVAPAPDGQPGTAPNPPPAESGPPAQKT